MRLKAAVELVHTVEVCRLLQCGVDSQGLGDLGERRELLDHQSEIHPKLIDRVEHIWVRRVGEALSLGVCIGTCPVNQLYE